VSRLVGQRRRVLDLHERELEGHLDRQGQAVAEGVSDHDAPCATERAVLEPNVVWPGNERIPDPVGRAVGPPVQRDGDHHSGGTSEPGVGMTRIRTGTQNMVPVLLSLLVDPQRVAPPVPVPVGRGPVGHPCTIDVALDELEDQAEDDQEQDGNEPTQLRGQTQQRERRDRGDSEEDAEHHPQDLERPVRDGEVGRERGSRAVGDLNGFHVGLRSCDGRRDGTVFGFTITVRSARFRAPCSDN